MLFAAKYLIAQAWMIAIQGQAAWSDAPQRATWVRFAPLAMISPVLVAVGADFSGDARTSWWVAAALVGVGGALNSARRRNDETSAWSINPSHFSERHSLFMIISLGEVLVAIGAKVTDKPRSEGLTTELVVTVIACVACRSAVVCVFRLVPEPARRTCHGCTATTAHVTRSTRTRSRTPRSCSASCSAPSSPNMWWCTRETHLTMPTGGCWRRPWSSSPAGSSL